jgi:hypothetical protein
MRVPNAAERAVLASELHADIAATRKDVFSLIVARDRLNCKAADPVADHRRWRLLWAVQSLSANVVAMEQRLELHGR